MALVAFNDDEDDEDFAGDEDVQDDDYEISGESVSVRLLFYHGILVLIRYAGRREGPRPRTRPVR